MFTSAMIFLLAALGQNIQQPVSSEDTFYPRLLHAELPLYPPLARSAHITGKVEIEVTVEKGSVVDAQVKSAKIQIADPKTVPSTIPMQKLPLADTSLTHPWQTSRAGNSFPEDEAFFS